ncbi:hypothetical protein [Paenibacillus donghaensis]|uniref:Uncharacterized protein n=1 Tax=Paenibacillus donghaensis TaxID=414771 RepID=A0A2Z2KHJ2_9BACL|nr:hypothetical protein [Paenibacillus donghaensis]ASA22650.1 hypothetical protein B9T62_18760 [Paenibacillus donghaensis]
MIEELIAWANDYKKRAREVVDILNYHQIMSEDAFRSEGRIQAMDDMLSFIEEGKTKEICYYCTEKPLIDRKCLMSSGKGDYSVFINSCNYLEDSEIGDWNAKFSLHGVKINYCPMCGRVLNE